MGDDIKDSDFEGCDGTQYTIHVTEIGKKQILGNNRGIERINDMMGDLGINLPLELWLASSITWEKESDKLEIISAYCRMLLDGDPQNEDSVSILNYIYSTINETHLRHSKRYTVCTICNKLLNHLDREDQDKHEIQCKQD